MESIQTCHPRGKSATAAKRTGKNNVSKLFYVGIDPGVNTGIAIWNKKEKHFEKIETYSIHKAFEMVEKIINGFGLENIHVRCEDARLRKWFGNAGREQLQGAGSIKRDSKIWDDYLTDLKISFEMVAPKGNITKLNAVQFERLTGFKGRTNEHSRDAAGLVFGF